MVGIVSSMIIGSIAADDNAQAAQDGSNAQVAAQRQAMKENNKRFAEFQKLMQPFIARGREALIGQQNLIGLNSPDRQRAAINGIRNGMEYQTLLNSANNNILQNASATGGLRGGNTQAALATISPNILSQLINQQYTRLGEQATMGFNASTNQGNVGVNVGAQNAQYLSNIGDAQAQGIMGENAANQQMLGGISQGLGQIGGGIMSIGMGGIGGFPKASTGGGILGNIGNLFKF